MSFVYDAEQAFRPKFTPERLVGTRLEAVALDRQFVAAALGKLTADDFSRAMSGGWTPTHFDRLVDFLNEQLAARSRERALCVEAAKKAPFEPASIANEGPLDGRMARRTTLVPDCAESARRDIPA